MRILFNLAAQSNDIKTISANETGMAHSILSSLCRDNGLPVAGNRFDRHISMMHMRVYDSIKNVTDEKLSFLPVTDVAVLSDLGNLQFQLTLHNRER